MCGHSVCKIKDDEAYIYLGYYDGSLQINGVDIYTQYADGVKNIAALEKYTKAELISFIQDMLDNTDE